MEVHALPSVTTAIQIGRALEEFKPMYYEESVKPLNASDMAKVAQNVNIPIATGERIYTRWGFRELFERQVVDVIQPDLCLVGGITEGKKICDMANTYDVTVQCHVCGGPVSTAAALHVEAVIPNFIIHEHVGQATMKGNRELVKQEMQPVNGYFDIPDTPGLGIELDDKVIAKYPCTKVS